MQLQQHIDDTPTTLRLLVDFAQQLHRVNGMNHRDKRCKILHLVRLQVANKVPLHVLRHLLHFLHQLLHVALAEDALTGIIGFAQHLHRMELAHRHKPNALGQVSQHFLQVLCYIAHIDLII